MHNLWHIAYHKCCCVFVFTEVVRAMTFVINQGMAMYWGTSRWSAMEIMVRLSSLNTPKLVTLYSGDQFSIYSNYDFCLNKLLICCYGKLVSKD